MRIATSITKSPVDRPSRRAGCRPDSSTPLDSSSLSTRCALLAEPGPLTLLALATLAALLALLLVAPGARADGFLVPDHELTVRPPEGPAPRPFAVKYHHVDTSIEGQVARTHVDQVFVNITPRSLEAVYLFPVPDGAVIDEFALWQNGEKITGEVLSAFEARRIYEDIVRRQRDPALLEYADRRLIRLRVFPIPAGGESRIEIRYTELLEATSGTFRYVYPLDTERFSVRPIESVRIAVDLHADIAIKNVYSPSHDVSVRRPDDRTATVHYEESGTRPDSDFLLYYALADDPIGMSLLTFEPPGEDGYFLLIASPRVELQEERIAAKDIVFVFDRTGSMSGDKIAQAREALAFALRSLNPRDRFDLIAFNEQPDPLFGGLVDASEANVERAVERAAGLNAEGGTNIAEALTSAVAVLGGDARPGYVVFLTDGLPTVGEKNIERILAGVAEAAPERTRLFAFGVGYDVNTTLLDGLAEAQRGAAQYVRPGEDLEVPVSDLARRLSYPVMTDLQLRFAGIEAVDLYPRTLGDMFRGSQILVAGRFRGGHRGDGHDDGHGTNGRGGRRDVHAEVTLSGLVNGEEQRFHLRQDLSRSRHEEFVALIWASRKIGTLVDEIRRHGQNQELVDEIVRLSMKYGIITEYTSFLVREPSLINARTGAQEAADRFRVFNAEKLAEEVGGSAVNQSINAAAQKQATLGGRLKGQSYRDAEGREVTIGGVTNVGARVFFRKQEAWVENTFAEDQEVLEIARFSRAQFQLVERDPALGRLMALGKEVLFLVNGNAVRIADTGIEELSEAQLGQLFGS
jgi:Ca-activated chloride channel family protein